MRRITCLRSLRLHSRATRRCAQPRLTLDYPAIAKRLVQQLALKPGERVMSIAHPGVFEDLLPYIRYEVMRAGGIDLGVVEVLREPVPESFDAAVLQKGARESRAYYKAMFRDVDAAIMMPGANTSHPAYLAMQDWLKDDLTEHRGRRTIHFHWIENGSAYPIAGQPLPSRPAMDALYQRALLETDYKALAEIERRFADGAQDRRRAHHVAGRHRPAIPRRRSARPICRTATRPPRAPRRARCSSITRSSCRPASSGSRRSKTRWKASIAFPPSQWDGRPVEGLRLRFSKGRVVEITAASGKDAVEAEMQKAGDAGRAFREIGLGFNPLLAVPERDAVDSVLRLRRRRRAPVARRQHRARRSRRRRQRLRPLEFLHRSHRDGRQHRLGPKRKACRASAGD